DDMEDVQSLDLSRRYSDPWGNDIATLLGNSGSSDSEGKNNPLLIKSPPFSGKTSMATLISHRLKTVATEKCLDNSSLFDHLQNSRAFSSVKNVSDEELQLVKTIVFSEGMIIENSSLRTDEKLIAESLVLKGVFVEYGAMNEQYVFSSPVMRRYFTEKVFGVPAGRAQENPTTLYDFIYAVLSSIDYNHIQSSLGKTKKTGILLERAWQMEFYRTSLRCTSDYVTSADVGGLFGTTGAIDFTVHSRDMKVFWGIELLREGNRLEDHARRFGDGGRYETICRMFTDSCVLDIRQQPTGARLDLGDLEKYQNLIIFTYDDSFSVGGLYSKLWEGRKPITFSK
ncbi:hypothetical protein HDU82_003815, partial [Entophlyctis luteolus]